MNQDKISYWLVIISFILVLVLFLWYIFGSSPTLEQIIIVLIASYSALFVYMDGKITRVERELTNKLETVERRLGDKIEKIKTKSH